VEYPTEDEILAMTNREFAQLIRQQAEVIDRMLNRDERPAALTPNLGEPWI
jgi:hypothetical protein